MDKGPRPAPPFAGLSCRLLADITGCLRSVSHDKRCVTRVGSVPWGLRALGPHRLGASLPPAPFLSSFQVLTNTSVQDQPRKGTQPQAEGKGA